MSDIPVPTLSTRGFVYDSKNKIDDLLSHFFLAENLQTALYVGRVASLPKLMQASAGDARLFISSTKQMLESYLERYYVKANVTVVSETDLESDPRVRIAVRISLELTEAEGTKTFERLLVSEGGRFASLVAMNNG